MPDPIFVDLKEVLEVHEEGLMAFGGSSGLRDRGALEAAIMAPHHYAYYRETEDMTLADILKCAAVYLHHISEAQAFIDGNKRTAVAVTLIFLLSNGVGVVDDQQGLFDLCIRVANHELDIEQITFELRKFVVE